MGPKPRASTVSMNSCGSSSVFSSGPQARQCLIAAGAAAAAARRPAGDAPRAGLRSGRADQAARFGLRLLRGLPGGHGPFPSLSLSDRARRAASGSTNTSGASSASKDDSASNIPAGWILAAAFSGIRASATS